MIINTGCRTDIPAYFSDWFFNRIKEGYVITRNPYNDAQVTQYRLSPEVVDCLVFCTKNPAPMLSRLHEIDAFKQFWSVTITPYGKEIEPHVPNKDKGMDSFIQLSKKVGVQAISWRYDPIFISETYSVEFHLHAFESMARKLSGYTDNCVISFIDLYEKTKRNFPGVKEVSNADRITLGKEFVQIGKTYGISIRSCCEGVALQEYGVDITGCMTQPVIERAIGGGLEIPKSKKGAREACDCLLGNDIGVYNTCGHGCLYCYANFSQELVIQNRKKHNPSSPYLVGNGKEGDQIKEAKQLSYRNGQLTLF